MVPAQQFGASAQNPSYRIISADRSVKSKTPVRRRDESGAGGRVPTHPWRHIGFKPSPAGGGTKLDTLLYCKDITIFASR